MKPKKTLVLKKSKWICGLPDKEGDRRGYTLGRGNTDLLNNKGFMCCLGQFSLQLDKSLNQCDIIGKTEPSDLDVEIPGLSNEISEGFSRYFKNTQLTNDAIDLNDNYKITVTEKVKRLKKLFSKHGYKIIVKP